MKYDDVGRDEQEKNDREIIVRLLRGDESARMELAENNMWLACHIARQYVDRGNMLEDLISVACVGLVKAMNHYDPTRNAKPSTYASHCIKNELLMYLRRNKNKNREISLEQTVFRDKDGNDMLVEDMIGTEKEIVWQEVLAQHSMKQIQKMVDTLQGRDKQVIEIRFGLGKQTEHTQNETAEILGVTQSYVSKIEKRALKELKERME